MSDYRVMDQMNHIPSKISILSLLLSSKDHRESMVKVLGASHVTKDITVDQFDGIIANIIVGSCLGFIDDELPSEGRAYNKALHISMKCLDTMLSKVLVDTMSLLNVMPKTTLMKLTLEGVAMRPNILIIKASDGSQRDVIGEVDLEGEEWSKTQRKLKKFSLVILTNRHDQ